MKLFDFFRLYYDPSTIVARLRRDGLLPMAINCPTCEDLMVDLSVQNQDGLIFSCNKRSCRKRKSIRTNSFFENSRLSLCESMLILHLWAKGYTEKLILDDFHFAKQTVVDWFRFCRDLCMFSFESDNSVIGGPGSVVELDETLAVKRKNNQGRILYAGWLFGGIERRNDGQFNCFVRMVYDRSEAHLTHLIRQHVALGTHIITDGWSAYRNLSLLGYSHSVVIHEQNFVSPADDQVHTQTIEATWSSFKRFIRSRGSNKGAFHLEYVCEYLFRRKNTDVFSSLLTTIRQKYTFDNS